LHKDDLRPSLCRGGNGNLLGHRRHLGRRRRRHGRAQRCQLARRGEPADVTDLGHDDQRSERADAGQLGEHLDPRVGPGPLADLPVQPVDPVLQRAGQAQVIPGQLAGHRGQLQRGEPGPGSRLPAAGPPAAAAPRSRRRPCRSSTARRRSPCTATGGPGAGRTRNPPAAAPASWCRSRPRTRPGCPAAGRRSPSESALARWARSGW
jgi:hypothetical protein